MIAPSVEASRIPAFRVFLQFLLLGCTSFGGPAAHVGFFQERFVSRLRWLDQESFSQYLTLANFLPGPSSSQLGMLIGLDRAGKRGLVAAWAGFTFPSALAMAFLGLGLNAFPNAWDSGAVRGIVAAVAAVVVLALTQMAQTLTSSLSLKLVAACTLLVVLLFPSGLIQVLVIVASALVGALLLHKRHSESPFRSGSASRLGESVYKRTALISALVLVAFLVALPLLTKALEDGGLRLLDAMYRAGSLVFGGGHVILPLLENSLVDPGLVGSNEFLAGYGLVQAMPGPLFTITSFLGAVAATGWPGGLLAGAATVAVFLPSALMVLAIAPVWDRVRAYPRARGALTAVGACVVGLLGSAVFGALTVTVEMGWQALVIAGAAFVALTVGKAAPWTVVIGAAAAGWLLL